MLVSNKIVTEKVGRHCTIVDQTKHSGSCSGTYAVWRTND